MYKAISPEEEKIGKAVVNAAYTIHKKPGPGLLENLPNEKLYH